MSISSATAGGACNFFSSFLILPIQINVSTDNCTRVRFLFIFRWSLLLTAPSLTDDESRVYHMMRSTSRSFRTLLFGGSSGPDVMRRMESWNKRSTHLDLVYHRTREGNSDKAIEYWKMWTTIWRQHSLCVGMGRQYLVARNASYKHWHLFNRCCCNPRILPRKPQVWPIRFVVPVVTFFFSFSPSLLSFSLSLGWS